MSKRPSQPEPIGTILRRQRIEVLHKGLREMARTLGIAPAHLTDIEKGRRNPSEDLLHKVCKHYGIDEATLRSGWNRPDTVVAQVASQDATTAKKVPALLRAAKDLSPAQWDSLIDQASRLAKSGSGKSSR